MRAAAILRPLPLAFLIFPFSFALQVLYQNERFGLIPYGLLFMSIGVFLFKAPFERNILWGSTGIRYLDIFVGLFLLSSTTHVVFGIALGGYASTEGARLFLIYVVGGWIYCYFSRYAEETEIRAVMVAITIASIVVGLHWVYETYTKMILLEVSEFQKLSISYTKMRQGDGVDDLNLAGVGTQYRAYGLVENHTTTGATVAIGAFAILALFPYLSLNRRLLLLSAFLIVLSIGQATTAWISYVFLMPLLLALAEDDVKARTILAKIALYTVLGFVAILIPVLSLEEPRNLFLSIVDLFSLQFSFIFNFDSSGETLSWFWLYVDHAIKLADFFSMKPFVMLIGEGPVGYGEVFYGRGGDVAVLEFIAAYGIPMTILFFASCMGALMHVAKSRKCATLNRNETMYLVFGFAVLAFLLLSLAHYDTLFKKSVIVCFYLALGLIRRYGYGHSVEGSAP